MARPVILTSALTLALLFTDCTKRSAYDFTEEPAVSIDLAQIKERGFLQAIVDNNSISYFIYKGRPMGYEYELLQSLTKHLKIELKIKVISGIEQSIDLLNRGEGDLIAFPLTITQDRTQYLSFTESQFNTYQVLVQKKPANWRRMPPGRVERGLIRNPVELIGKEVYVLNESSFKTRLQNLSMEVGGEIIIREDSASAETESLIQKVASGEFFRTAQAICCGRLNTVLMSRFG